VIEIITAGLMILVGIFTVVKYAKDFVQGIAEWKANRK
jgi:uncharacterized membrane protein